VSVVLAVSAALLAVAAALVLVRLLRGPSLHDRLVAIDTLVVILACGIAVESIRRGSVTDLVLLVVIALVGFLSTLTALRLASEEQR
jgi:multicomponent Na+:H+ antiporter subunit F